MLVGDRILAAIFRGQPQQIVRPDTSPQAFFAEKKYFCYCFCVFLTIARSLEVFANFHFGNFIHLRCHNSTTRLENTAVTVLAQNANGMRNTEIALNRKFQ